MAEPPFRPPGGWRGSPLPAVVPAVALALTAAHLAWLPSAAVVDFTPPATVPIPSVAVAANTEATPMPAARGDRLDRTTREFAEAPVQPPPAVSGEVVPTLIANAAPPDRRVPIPREKPLIPGRVALADPAGGQGALPAAPASGAPNACLTALASARAGFAPSAPVGNGACTIVAPLILSSAGAGTVKLQPAATVGCALAQSFDDWVRKAVQPAALAELGEPITALRIAASYSCRPVDNITGAKLSQHAFGNAIDIGAFQIGGKSWIVVGGKADPREAKFFATVRKAACSYFTTVLGPGSDAYHADNLHLDLARHGNSGTYRICQ